MDQHAVAVNAAHVVAGVAEAALRFAAHRHIGLVADQIVDVLRLGSLADLLALLKMKRVNRVGRSDWVWPDMTGSDRD